ncbi:hypothetical protein [Nocardia aurea]|uniref:ESX-1 secretion-associated protein n=1 Tax=Nocardia aurea TaxID=2144174 RepID=A0ABV3G1Q1_9NOCA
MGVVVLMDVAALQRISRDLKFSASAVNDSAVRVSGSVRDFVAGSAGQHYRRQGEQMEKAFETLRRSLFASANCVNDCGDALEVCAASYVGVDQTTATDLGAVAGVFP